MVDAASARWVLEQQYSCTFDALSCVHIFCLGPTGYCTGPAICPQPPTPLKPDLNCTPHISRNHYNDTELIGAENLSLLVSWTRKWPRPSHNMMTQDCCSCPNTPLQSDPCEPVAQSFRLFMLLKQRSKSTTVGS